MTNISKEGRASAPVVRDKAFAKRLETACEGHPLVPTDEYRGKQKWVRENLEKRFALKVSPEAVRKWFSGESRPRPKLMSSLARLLEVDEAWLSLGIKPDHTPKEKEVRSALAAGSVNVVAGFIQMNGGNIAYPESSGEQDVDMFAIISGKQHNIEVKVADELKSGKLRFVVGQNYERHTVIGIVIGQGFSIRLLRFPTEIIRKHGERRGDYLELSVVENRGSFKAGGDPVPEITDIREL